MSSFIGFNAHGLSYETRHKRDSYVAACHITIQAIARQGVHKVSTRLASEYVEGFVRKTREKPDDVIRILNKDVLPEWGHRDARTINSREVIELLDKIVHRGSPVRANRTANILTQMFKYGVHRAIVDHSTVQLLFRPGGKERNREGAS